MTERERDLIWQNEIKNSHPERGLAVILILSALFYSALLVAGLSWLIRYHNLTLL